jgi:hypothetical protein
MSKKNISFNANDLGADLTYCILSNAEKSGKQVETKRTADGSDTRCTVKGLTDEDKKDLEGYVQYHSGKTVSWGKGK